MEKLNMTTLEKHFLTHLENRKSFKIYSTKQLEELEDKLYEMLIDNISDQNIVDKLDSVQNELRHREDDMMFRAECGDEDYDDSETRLWNEESQYE
jgi:hypothetical protein